jgi:hypothetical protein
VIQKINSSVFYKEVNACARMFLSTTLHVFWQKFSMMVGTLLEEVLGNSTTPPPPLGSHIPRNVPKTMFITKEPFVLAYSSFFAF